MPVIQLDLNNPEFQANLLALDKPDAWAVLKTLRLLQTMSWEQLQGSKGPGQSTGDQRGRGAPRATGRFRSHAHRAQSITWVSSNSRISC